MTQFNDRDEMFREFVAEHLRKQTKFLDTIRTILILWLVLTLIGAVFFIAALVDAGSSGF
jgi:hypothetical protein